MSSDLQSDSLPSQVAWGNQVAKEHGWTVDRVFEGVGSGKHGVRKLMTDLLTELQATPKVRRPQRILMVRLDRTGRGDTLEVLGAIGQIRKLGVTIHTRSDGDLRLETVADTMKPIFEAFQAGLENEVRSDRSRAGHERKRREGKHAGHAPYGTVLIDGKPRAYEPEAQIVREIFDLRLQGWGLHRIARQIAAKAPDKRKSDGTFRTMKWGEATIGTMLKCQTYVGILIDAQVYQEAQATTLRGIPRVRETSFPWPLRGAVRCSCGHALSTVASGPKRSRVRYYTCRNVAVHQRYPYHNAKKLEAQFVDLLKRLQAADPSLFYSEDAVDVAPLERQRRAVEMEKDKLEARRSRVWSLFESGTIDAEEIAKRIDEIKAERQKLDRRADELTLEISRRSHQRQVLQNAGEVLSLLVDTWETAKEPHQREAAKVIAALLDGLYCKPEEPGILHNGHDEANLRFSEKNRGFASTLERLLTLA